MSFEKFPRKEDDDKSRKGSNYFQTEFSISLNRRKDENQLQKESHEKSEGNVRHRKKNISVQAGRNIIGQEEIPKERKKWIRPPLVGQASTSTEVVIPALQETESEDEIIETSHPTAESTLFVTRNDYRNRKDYISEKPPEGGSTDIPASNQGEHVKSASPTSSVTSSRPLEWDSGADVGYFQFYSGQNKDSELSTLERLALERGSASLLTRSDPEGTTCSSVKQNVAIGRPAAESTPVNTLNKKKSEEADKEDYYPLFPEVIVEEHGQISDSDITSIKGGELPFKKSNSLEAVAEAKPEEGPATFPRSQSQSNITFNINNHLQKVLGHTKSNSSSSIATVVTGRKKKPNNISPETEMSTGDRANSFEYLPGHVYENKSSEIYFGKGGDLKKDVERGVQLMTEFMNSNANNTLLKKELLQRVVEALISAEYLSDKEFSPKLQRCVTRRSHNRDISGESSVIDNLQDSLNRKTDKEYSTVGQSANSSKPTTNNSSSQNSTESRTSEPLFRRVPKLPSEKVKINQVNDLKDSTDSSKNTKTSSSDWKEPVTRSEKLFEARKLKGKTHKDTYLMHFLHSERENQIDWIKKEISHLSNLKHLLEKHEFLRKNFATLRGNKQRAVSADAFRSTRQQRRKTEVTAAVQSEPALGSKLLFSKKQNQDFSESDYNSHNYDTDRGDGILRRHASTGTADMKVSSGWQTLKPKQSLAYTIVFEPEREKENINHRDIDRIIECTGPVADRENLMKISRHRIKEQLSKLSIQDELLSKRPDYVARAEGRRQIVAELTALRELRQQHKTNILSAAVCGTENLQPIPPHPLALKRVVSQKAMRNLTEKKYKQTFEVQKKQEDHKRKEEYRTNRLMADVFKKKLQKRLLKGQTDLSNSVNIISSSV